MMRDFTWSTLIHLNGIKCDLFIILGYECTTIAKLNCLIIVKGVAVSELALLGITE